MLLFVYTTTHKSFVIFTCRYFKLSWNITALSQSNCSNFSCSSITDETPLILYPIFYIQSLGKTTQRLMCLFMMEINRYSVPIKLLLLSNQFVFFIQTKHQGPVAQEVDETIHWMNLYPVDKAIGFPYTYLLDSDLSVG